MRESQEKNIYMLFFPYVRACDTSRSRVTRDPRGPDPSDHTLNQQDQHDHTPTPIEPKPPDGGWGEGADGGLVITTPSEIPQTTFSKCKSFDIYPETACF